MNYKTNNIFVRLPKEKFIDLYLYKNMSLSAISRRMKIRLYDIVKLRNEYTIPLRSEVEHCRNKLNRETLYCLYHDQDLSFSKIAKMYQVGPRTIRNLLIEFGINLKPVPVSAKSVERKHHWGKSPLRELSKETLHKLYHKKGYTYEKIGSLLEVTKQAIYKKMREYNIVPRTRWELNRLGINEEFFTKWSKEMAYVLGLLFTDGCLHKVKNSESYIISLAIDYFDKEILKKIKKWMASKHKIVKHKGSHLHSLSFSSKKMAMDLISFGMKERKSLDLSFPHIPEEYICDFVRGCWDGDGSVYKDRMAPSSPLRASFVSGSLNFITGLRDVLTKYAGLREVKIYSRFNESGRISYMIRYCHSGAVKLCHYFYDNTPKDLYMNRKYQTFVNIMKSFADINNRDTPIQHQREPRIIQQKLL